jgi:hypothetical protein
MTGRDWILYRSTAVVPVTAALTLDIVRAAERNNAAEGLTGMLVYSAGGGFLQLIEGESDALNHRFDRIRGDARHRMQWIRAGTCGADQLAHGPAMGYVNADAEPAAGADVRPAWPEEALSLARAMRRLARGKYPRAAGRDAPCAWNPEGLRL